MANLPEFETYEEGIYQLETTDPVVAGPGGISNQQAKQLANRTAWLKQQVDTLIADLSAMGIPDIAYLQSALDNKLNTSDFTDHIHDWDSITGKPSSFTPSSHSHSWISITDKPSSFTPSSHSHSWSSITGKPSSFTPSSHSHSWISITDKPSSFTPSSHSHSWSSITGKPSSFTPSSHTHTKAQVGLGNVPNYGASNSYTSTSSTTLATSKAVKDGLATVSNTASKNQNGYIKCTKTGVIIQWAYIYCGSNTNVLWTFPTAFPNFCRFAVCNPNLTTVGARENVAMYSLTKSNARLVNGHGTGLNFYVLAMGY